MPDPDPMPPKCPEFPLNTLFRFVRPLLVISDIVLGVIDLVGALLDWVFGDDDDEDPEDDSE